MRRVLIVNADDYGLAPGVDAGIREAASRGIVTSVSVMSERVTRDAVLRLLDVAPGIGLGLHADLTTDLVATSPNGAARRIRDQIGRFTDVVGRAPDHLDTHKHAHLRDRSVLAALAGHGLPVRANDRRTRNALRAGGVPCTDAFVGGVGLRPWWTLRRLRAAIRALPPGTTELMCHPGHADEIPDGLFYRDQRVEELRTFTADRLRERIGALGIELATFAVLR